MKRKILMFLMAVVMLFGMAGCADADSTASMAKLGWSMGVREDGKYDTSVFYRNDNTFSAPDPCMIYITEGEEEGYYYFYPTGVGGMAIPAYRTKDFVHYELMNGAAFTFQQGGWAVEQLWAPEVMYWKDPDTGKGLYIMYYTSSHIATDENLGSSRWDGMNTGIAVSETPAGPFVDYTGEQFYQPYNAEGQRIDPDDGNRVLSDDEPAIWKTRTVEMGTPPLFYVGDTPSESFEIGSVAYEYLKDMQNPYTFATIDADPFIDEDGQMYLYFVKHQDTNHRTNEIWAVQMKDPFSPIYETLTHITVPGKKTVDATESFDTENILSYNTTVNEGPTVVRHTTDCPDGTQVTKYYLAYSNYGVGEKVYGVYQAVADSPLGPFVKLDAGLGQPLIHAEMQYDYISGTGHNFFFETPCGELFTSYHSWCTPDYSEERGIMVDRVRWVYNEQLGYDVMYCNGPTQSLQAKPESMSGYKNIAGDAAVDVTNIATGNPSLLNDDLVAIHNTGAKLELRTEGKTTVTLTFPEARSVRAIMVYNSFELDYAFSKLDRVVIEDAEGHQYYAEDVVFPTSYLSKDKEGNATQIHVGSAATIVFREQEVKKITITISEKIEDSELKGTGIGLSEIVVLGK